MGNRKLRRMLTVQEQKWDEMYRVLQAADARTKVRAILIVPGVPTGLGRINLYRGMAGVWVLSGRKPLVGTLNLVA